MFFICTQLLELAGMILKVESGAQRLENVTMARIAVLTARSARAVRERQSADADADNVRRAVAAGKVVQAEQASVSGETDLEELALPRSGLLEEVGPDAGGGASSWVGSPPSSGNTIMSIFELDEEEDEDEAGEWAMMVQDGDDEGVLPARAPEAADSGEAAAGGDFLGRGVEGAGAGAAGLGGDRDTFVELTRRVLGDLDEANVTGSGSLELSQLRRSFKKLEAGDNGRAATESSRSPRELGRAESGKNRDDAPPASAGGEEGARRGAMRSRGGDGPQRGNAARGGFKARFGGQVRFGGAVSNKARWPLASGTTLRPDGGLAGGAGRGTRRGASPGRRGSSTQRRRSGESTGAGEGDLLEGTQILLVRHGQSTWNAQGRWQGQADMPLSSLGVAQSALAAVRLASNQTVFSEEMGIVNITAVYTSNMQRAVQTASILAQQAGLGSVIEDERLRERSVGEWSGLTYEEVRAQHHRDFTIPAAYRDTVHAPGLPLACHQVPSPISHPYVPKLMHSPCIMD